MGLWAPLCELFVAFHAYSFPIKGLRLRRIYEAVARSRGDTVTSDVYGKTTQEVMPATPTSALERGLPQRVSPEMTASATMTETATARDQEEHQKAFDPDVRSLEDDCHAGAEIQTTIDHCRVQDEDFPSFSNAW